MVLQIEFLSLHLPASTVDSIAVPLRALAKRTPVGGFSTLSSGHISTAFAKVQHEVWDRRAQMVIMMCFNARKTKRNNCVEPSLPKNVAVSCLPLV